MCAVVQLEEGEPGRLAAPEDGLRRSRWQWARGLSAAARGSARGSARAALRAWDHVRSLVGSGALGLGRRGPPRLTRVARDLSWGEVERVEAVRPRAQASCC